MVPLVTPVTWPVAGSTVALELFTLQKPPEVLFDNVTVPDTQTADGPEMAAGRGFTVIEVNVLQPLGKA